MEKSDDLRTEFIETIDSYPQYKLYYVDECGIDKYIYCEYAYAPRGIPVLGKISGRKFKRTNIIAAKCGADIIAPMTYTGTTDNVLFEYWFEKVLLKAIPEYSLIIMDNATFHRKSVLQSLANNHACEVLFLPPYSPDLNPIENFWAWLKSKFRNILPCYDNFDEALMDCFQFI